MKIAALYCRKNSVYRSIPGVDVFDEERDALTFEGGAPVVAHPPCGPWGKLRHFCKSEPGVRDLAFHALRMVRTWGGVLEHPSTSKIFHCAGVDSRPGRIDLFGGFCMTVPQRWFGHRAEKLTTFYICGIRPGDVPAFPLSFDLPTSKVELMGKAEREHTPLQLALWLCDVVRQCDVLRVAA